MKNTVKVLRGTKLFTNKEIVRQISQAVYRTEYDEIEYEKMWGLTFKKPRV